MAHRCHNASATIVLCRILRQAAFSEAIVQGLRALHQSMPMRRRRVTVKASPTLAVGLRQVYALQLRLVRDDSSVTDETPVGPGGAARIEWLPHFTVEINCADADHVPPVRLSSAQLRIYMFALNDLTHIVRS